jgi:hypothetical protein
MSSSGICRREVPVSTDVSEGENTQGTKNTLAVAGNLARWVLYANPKCRFLQEPHGDTSQKTTFFIVPAAKTSNLT